MTTSVWDITNVVVSGQDVLSDVIRIVGGPTGSRAANVPGPPGPTGPTGEASTRRGLWARRVR